MVMNTFQRSLSDTTVFPYLHSCLPIPFLHVPFPTMNPSPTPFPHTFPHHESIPYPVPPYLPPALLYPPYLSSLPHPPPSTQRNVIRSGIFFVN